MKRNNKGQFVKGCKATKKEKEINSLVHKGINTWMKGKHNSPATEIKKGDKEEKSLSWKGDNVGKKGVHKWVERWKGKPNHCEMCGTTEKRMYHWANINHTYKRVLDDYIRLCVPCHKKYDNEKNKDKNKSKRVKEKT